MMSKKFFLFFFFVLLISSASVIAQPPGQTLGDLTIIYPKIETLPYGVNSELHFHAVSSLGTTLPNTDFTCQAHVYNSVNEHVIEMNGLINDSNGYDKVIPINSSVHNELGWKSYNVFCQSIDDSGAVSDSFEITPDGQEYTFNNVIWIAIILSMIMFSAGTIWVSMIIQANRFVYLKRLMFLFGVANLFMMSILPMLISSHPSITSLREYFIGYFLVSVFALFAFIIFYWLGWTRELMDDGFNALRGKKR